MKLFRGLPNLGINVLCLILVFINLIYTMSVFGFEHLDTKFILNSLFCFSLFIGSILLTVLFVSLIVIFYILKKLDLLEGKFMTNLNNFSKNLSNFKKTNE